MKMCTYCGREYPDEAKTCDLDQEPLITSNSSVSLAPTTADDLLPRQVLAPAAAWVGAAFLFYWFLGPAGLAFLHLVTAGWAAMDCSELRARGSHQLGIAFKPVVVFGVCAFFLFGFGFIWYLVMRHRVKSGMLLASTGPGHDQIAEPGASPNGGPTTPLGNSGATEGPPSVS